MSNKNLLGTRTTFESGYGEAFMYSLAKLQEKGFDNISRLPFSIKVLLEAVLRECDDYVVSEDDVKSLANYDPKNPIQEEIPFKPARVILQDFTGVPVVVDLAALRSAMSRMGGDPKKINPIVPVDLVIDHSIQVDHAGDANSFEVNTKLEFERNLERYEFLRWGQQALDNFGVVPPARGIVHQINLEFLAKAVWSRDEEDKKVFYPDSLVGTDSHTTMINGLGIVGWGVGGIEAEAVMLGQPIYMLIPEVIGFKLTGKLKEGLTATDLTLTIVQMLRQKGVVGKFVEFYGTGLSNISLPDRATIANMAPEYGATIGFFPVDTETLRFLRRTGRPEELVVTVENYTKLQGLFRTDDTPDPYFTDTLELDLSTVEPSLAGPKRPQDRVPLSLLKSDFEKSLTDTNRTKGFGLTPEAIQKTGAYKIDTEDKVKEVSEDLSVGFSNETINMKHGDVVIAAITSCTNTSNPSVMLGAGLLAKKAVEKGLKVPPYVKTSLAPGSRVVTEYLNEAGLTESLDKLGFNLVGYGCTTCIGNSGPISDAVEHAIKDGDLIVAGVLSGNRNFEGRIHQSVKANYLASPPLVVAYALAGTVDIDLTKDPIGKGKDGEDVYLKDIWPSSEEVNSHLENAVRADLFNNMYGNVANSNEEWNNIHLAGGELFAWNPDSTYIQEPPFFVDLAKEPSSIQPIVNARVLVKVGDSITTDHISPAGSIKKDTPAGQYLIAQGIKPEDFNSYGSRRGNDRVMTRGTFANIRLKNMLAPGTEGGYTVYFPTKTVQFIYDASLKYKEKNIPLVVLAGKEYGTGSSRDWAAKGTYLLGVRLVIAESFERIHRANLVGMGVLPLQYKADQSADSLELEGDETFEVVVDDNLKPRQEVEVIAKKADGSEIRFQTVCRIDTPVEVDYYRNGGILQTVLRSFLREG
jgi:aconitate hydratase